MTTTEQRAPIAPAQLDADGSDGWAAVRLRPLKEADVPRIVEACQDAQTQRWTVIPVPYGTADAHEFLEIAATGRRTGQTAIFAISTPETAYGYCGSIDLRMRSEGVAGVGFSVAPWARGAGVGSSALRLLCQWGFAQFGLARIEWEAIVGNWPSRRLAERVGFQYEGTVRHRGVQRGVRVDEWIAGLLPGDLR